MPPSFVAVAEMGGGPLNVIGSNLVVAPATLWLGVAYIQVGVFPGTAP